MLRQLLEQARGEEGLFCDTIVIEQRNSWEKVFEKKKGRGRETVRG